MKIIQDLQRSNRVESLDKTQNSKKNYWITFTVECKFRSLINKNN